MPHPETTMEPAAVPEATIESQSQLAALALVAPPTTPEPQRIGIMNRWQLPGDVAHKATEGLPEFERENLRWLQRWAAQGNYTRTEVAAMLRKPNGDCYSSDSIYQALTGRRSEQGASLRPLAEAVATLRKRVSETEAARSGNFVETRLTKRMWAVCRQAFLKHRMAFIFGPPQIGKSVGLDEYHRNYNHGETYLVRMPTRGAITHFLGELASRVRVPAQRREDEMRRRIMDCFDEKTLLIVDEAHQCLLGRGDSGALTLEFIREIHDRRKCGVVICGTEVLSHHLQNNKILRQLWLRRSPGLTLHLSTASVSTSDLAAFARAFGLDPAPDSQIGVRYLVTGADGEERQSTFRANPFALQSRIVSQDGLGAWCKLLEDARDLAHETGAKLTWGRVLTAFCLAQATDAQHLAQEVAS